MVVVGLGFALTGFLSEMDRGLWRALFGRASVVFFCFFVLATYKKLACPRTSRDRVVAAFDSFFQKVIMLMPKSNCLMKCCIDYYSFTFDSLDFRHKFTLDPNSK